MPASARFPLSTYRIQLHEGFPFGALAEQLDYLAALGVSHVYLSPILQAVPGSTHGYDVVDHSRLSEDLGGGEAFARLRGGLQQAGLGAVADVVPNHVAVPTPVSLNTPLWSVLKEGPRSPYAAWFDVDWSAHDRAVLMPVLGDQVGRCIDAGEITLDSSGEEPVVRYYDHALPVREGTEDLPLDELLDRQYYRLAHWRVADEELNYRRFFDIDTLAGLRVEDEAVFAETHAVLIAMVREGSLDGLRIDHPDGLADPREYLRRLQRATDGTWVVVEKILEGEEDLPADWPCAGTTGYDALLRVGGLFVAPDAASELTALYHETTGEPPEFGPVVEAAKRDVVEHSLYAEVNRLVELAATICEHDIRIRDHTRRGLRECLVEVLVAFPRYRAYVVPGERASEEATAVVEHAVERARTRLPEERHPTLDLVRDLALARPVGSGRREARRDEFVVRFQQTCGPVMAKGVEDTAFYRWFRLSSLNEVGGDPEHLGVAPEEFHRWCESRQRDWPTAMTSLSTHDTKRSEDVRARLGVLAEDPAGWAAAVAALRILSAPLRPEQLDPNTEYLVWQTLVGTWAVPGSAGSEAGGPISAERLVAYLEKATREAKRHTTWTNPSPAYDDAVRGFAERVLADDRVLARVAAYVEETAAPARAAILGQKLVALTMPGVPDTYQGTEAVDLSLVDPDNRRPVDYEARRSALARLDKGEPPTTLDEEKVLVTSRALRLRAARPEAFGTDGGYAPLVTSTPYAVGFLRGGTVATVVTRLAARVHREGGWGDATLELPEGRWRDHLTGRSHEGGTLALDRLLTDLPVALLEKVEES